MFIVKCFFINHKNVQSTLNVLFKIDIYHDDLLSYAGVLVDSCIALLYAGIRN